MFKVPEIIKATGGMLIQGPGSAGVGGISIDSRMVKRSQAFVAVKGDVFDGHEFVADVLAKNVRVVVVHRPVVIKDPRVSVILVKDTTKALGDLARFHRLRFKTPVIALTGSAGKTTTKEMLATVLGRKYKVLKNEGTQNNHIGVPLTLLKIKPLHQMVVLECGTNQPGDIPWLADVSRPDVAVFTNVGESHLEKLKTPGGVLKEKWSLVSFSPKRGIVLNADDPFLYKQKKRSKLGITTYGVKQKSDFQAADIKVKGGQCLTFRIKGKVVELHSCGINNVYNALAAVVVARLFSVPWTEIIKALRSFEFPSGRGQILRLGRGWLINDAYNANPVSMRSALDMLNAVPADGKRILVAADMLELGERTAALHRSMGYAVATSRVDVLITVGEWAGVMGQAARSKNKQLLVIPCQDSEMAHKQLAAIFHNGDAVLVKGSRRMKMETVVEFLLASPGGFLA
jgi:UDP-N-acetylmuramoyl-tripeptide--D-alanyl-D-alanine ligase